MSSPDGSPRNPALEEAALQEAAARARHDLGKYIFFQARWLDAGASEEPSTAASLEALREALREDLLHTRKGPDGVVGAAALWAQLRRDLLPAGVEEIEAMMHDLTDRAVRLDTLDGPALQATADLARRVADALRALHNRLRR